MTASQYPEAAFLAAMTASATHEVRNVLAIIKESAGLVDDMVRVFGARGALDQEKVLRALSRIDVQVKRGAELLTNLNRLSHTVDEDMATVNLGQEVQQLVFLSQRFAKKGGHAVLAGPLSENATARVSPLRLHMGLYAAMEFCLGRLAEGASVTVAVAEIDGAPCVDFSCEAPAAQGPGTASDGSSPGEAWGDLSELVSSLGAVLERAEVGFGVRILFPPRTGV
jgi:hypothetical protein